jgi:hypothetical protein
MVVLYGWCIGGATVSAQDKIDMLIEELSAASGYMLNAILDLETSTKLAGMKTLAEGKKRIDAALAQVQS